MAAPAPCDAGWSRALYDSACAACEAAPGDAPSRRRSRGRWAPYEALSSLWHQMHSARVRKSAHGHRERAGEYAAAWAGGESLPAIASRVGFPPFSSRLAAEGARCDAGDAARAGAHRGRAPAPRRRGLRGDRRPLRAAPRRRRAPPGAEYEMLLRGVVNWVDSKAMFGSPAAYGGDHRAQPSAT
ncbi:hypothetical protein JL720_8560 [Aureococcus anophagefferens]|nr:hypothetical protein JL720_8560 [Aureococcus anophagefferens]